MTNLWKKLLSFAAKRNRTSPKNEDRQPAGSPEAEMLIGGLPTHSNRPSLLFFTVHKAASSFVGEMLKRIARIHQFVPVDYMQYLIGGEHDDRALDSRLILESLLPKTLTDRPALNSELAVKMDRELARLFPLRGFQFGPLRMPYLLAELPHLERYRTLIQLRDPRDCLTSIYFSRAFSHVLPPDPELKKQFLAKRSQARETPIDEYVLSEAPIWLENYQRYAEALRKSPHLKIVKYEQMVLDFPAWLNEVEQAWGFGIEPDLRRSLIDQADFKIEEEDIYRHKRQVLPGDHLRKLQPETICRLTSMFAPVLNELGYPLDATHAPAA